ncbi:hypothetical protein ABBQ32_008764 [Trebouxia sp. C0010 RCD-2024]
MDGSCPSAKQVYGVVKKFAAFLLLDSTGSEPPLYVIPKKSRHLMSRSEGEINSEVWPAIQMHSGCLKSYQLVEWLHFLEIFNLFVLRNDILDKLMQTMWDKLRYL